MLLIHTSYPLVAAPFCRLAILFIYSISVLTPLSIHAQYYEPMPAYASNSVFIESKAMYVLGGYAHSALPSDPITAQMFSLDLSKPWRVSNPLYQRLPDGYGGVRFPGALMKNNQEWFVLINTTTYSYNLGARIWQRHGQFLDPPGLGLAAATDPVSGWVYIPNGHYSPTTGRHLMAYHPETNDYFYEEPQQPGLLRVINYMTTWAPGRNSLLIFGGSTIDTSIAHDALYAYSKRGGWEVLQANGIKPSARRLGCFIPAYSGTKMILFGGQGTGASTSDSGPTLGDIYILDVATLTWTRGVDVGPTGARAAHVCAFSNDQLIVWGGFPVSSATINPILIYNLKTSRWTTEYTTGSSGPTRQSSTDPLYVPPTAASSSDSQSSSSNLLVIIGAIVGTVILFALIGTLLSRHKNNKRQQKSVAKLNGEVELVAPPDVDPPVILVAPEPLAQSPFSYHAIPHQALTSPVQEHVQPRTLAPEASTYVDPEEQRALEQQRAQADMMTRQQYARLERLISEQNMTGGVTTNAATFPSPGPSQSSQVG
ncbi:hypothetical protein BCR41DRAFT_403151 [Lobosporangium transversale]|uniref:Galactose oxidase n=1 Tax=Lobosporangium transversale TaxID=64571 RepID=A0A1Y2H3H8_9FUNG|nr:hypothetical protein BCR41DRAFT_403151 [Lobosporangium transversale]ORZ29075.1 hypothetical protein BCR41DRAFT_403151 [Lobosporangium transversale]|eukprot:XP_021886748.1 hypothetical protein BCR41DRAFT_403151 [Lobosporangium transversale]